MSIAGSCVDCLKRTGHNNKLLFSDLGKQDACTDPNCLHAKVEAHVAKQIAAKPQLVQITTTYGKQQEGSKALPHNPVHGKFAADAIITEGSDVGTVHKVCANPTCPVHHPKLQTRARG
jgi:ParB family chromosome partitioning protein